jgi:hypothetical protein
MPLITFWSKCLGDDDQSIGLYGDTDHVPIRVRSNRCTTQNMSNDSLINNDLLTSITNTSTELLINSAFHWKQKYGKSYELQYMGKRERRRRRGGGADSPGGGGGRGMGGGAVAQKKIGGLERTGSV